MNPAFRPMIPELDRNWCQLARGIRLRDQGDRAYSFLSAFRYPYEVVPIYKVLPIAPTPYHDRVAQRRDYAMPDDVFMAVQLKPNCLRQTLSGS